MTMIRRALRDNGMATTVVSMSAISSTLLLLGHLVSRMLSLETKISVVLFISFGLLHPLQFILVGKRRCSGHWLVQYTAMAAYYLSTPLAFYAVHAACSASHFDESFAETILLILLFLFVNLYFSPTTRAPFFTNMRAYSLRDGPQDPYRFVLSVVYLAYLEWEWTRISSANRGIMMQVLYDVSPNFEEWVQNNGGLVPLLLNMSVHFGFLLVFLFVASKPPESTLDYETKAVAEYMKRESSMSRSPFFDDDGGRDGDADCCRYPFTQRKDGQWISIRDLSQRADLSKEDQDICLSYSLCRLLARRYYGFLCAEEGDAKVRRFALARLGRDGYKRAFTNVEVQLAFLHDYFFTTNLRIVESKFYMLSYKMPSATCIFSVLVLVVAVGKQNHWFIKEARLEDYGPDLLLAITLMIALPYVLITPQQLLLAIYWRPIQIVFHKLDLHTPTTSIWGKFLKRIYHSPNELDVHRLSETQTTTVYWRNKIGQYSVLLDYDRRRSRKKELVAWFERLVRPQPWYRFVKHLPVEEDVRVPDSVRKLVADTLRAIDGPPTNGTRSLKINMDSSGYDWSWTCRQQTHTHTILIWHIATCYCGDLLEEEFPLLVETKTFHEVATALSRYCTYLVAFLPEFLPEHSLITKEVFQNVIQDAQRALGSTHMEEKEKQTKIRMLKLLPRHKQTTFHKGVRLGRQLQKLNTRLRWKVMAQFWAETFLYVAPSDNVEAHIERLAKGGEFVTHVWAMLSNAGILKREEGEWHPPASTTINSPVPNAQDAGGVEWSNRIAGGAYRSNKIGQYSILQDFNCHRSLKKVIVAWFKGTILSEPSSEFIKHLPVKTLDSIRKLVADTLWDIDGPPTNGSRSIKINRDSARYDWSWTCRQQTHTHTILIWHIATCYCDQLEEFPLMPDTLTFHKVATALSRYCAYLVAFLPEFLLEHSLITKEVFQNVILDAHRELGSTHMEVNEKQTKIRKLKLPPRDEQTTFHKGVRLGRQLQKLKTRLRWKVMAEFWVETILYIAPSHNAEAHIELKTRQRWKVVAEFWAVTILYIAPSDNAEAHIEDLAKGGEFITHLWAIGELCSSCKGPLTQGSIVPYNDEAPACSSFSPPSSHRDQTSKYTKEEKGKQPEIQ